MTAALQHSPTQEEPGFNPSPMRSDRRDIIIERRGRVKIMTQQGMSAAEIARILHTTERTVQRDRSALGIADPSLARPPLSDEIKARMADLIADECPPVEISRTLGVSRGVIRKYFPEWQGRSGGVLGKYHRELAYQLGLPVV